MDGFWNDFKTSAGVSSHWVSGFLLWNLAPFSEMEKNKNVCQERLISEARPSGGWAYNERVVEDCDSISWVFKALIQRKLNPPLIIRNARGLILLHQKPSGGFSTYRNPKAIADVIHVQSEDEVIGWCSEHTCVTANALHALILSGLTIKDEPICAGIKFLQSKQMSNGLWEGYWWNGFAYTTYLSALALSSLGLMDVPSWHRIDAIVLAGQSDNGGWKDQAAMENSFSTSLYISTLLLSSNVHLHLNKIRLGVDWLLQHQKNDGSWDCVPILKIPPSTSTSHVFSSGYEINGLGTSVIVEDQNRLFASSTALKALHHYYVASFPDHRS